MEIIRSGEWCELSVLTADLVKDTGGKVLHFKKCRIARRKQMEESGSSLTSFTGITKPANHNFHFTVNLELENGQIRKIHPVLIFKINNQRVA